MVAVTYRLGCKCHGWEWVGKFFPWLHGYKLKKCYSLLVRTSLLIGKAAWAVDEWTWLRSDLLSSKLLSYPARAVTCTLQVAQKKSPQAMTLTSKCLSTIWCSGTSHESY